MIPFVEPYAETISIDGAALIDCLPQKCAKSFLEYAMLYVISTIQAYCTKFKRTDILDDVNLQSGLKAETSSIKGHR